MFAFFSENIVLSIKIELLACGFTKVRVFLLANMLYNKDTLLSQLLQSIMTRIDRSQ